MHRTLINIILLFYPLALCEGGLSDPDIYTTRVFDPRIKTFQLYREGWNLSYPVLQLGGSEKLVLHFDLLGDNYEAYYYTFIHCDKDWKRSDIFTNEYMEGFPENPIEDSKPSFNTTVSYTHYSLVFPNDRVKLKFSGNYILYIYKPEEPEKPVITYRFIVTENGVKISLNVHRPRMTSDNNAGQQVDFNVDISGANIIDPYRNIFASLLQNGRWDNALNNMKPDIYGGNELKYSSLSEKNIFPGGNEFRYFDVRSIRYLSEFVRRIDFMAPYYHFYLALSESRAFKPYFYSQDFNGKYYIATQEGRNPDTDADYVNVYFTFTSANILRGGDIYVNGSLGNWSFSNDNLMIYNPERKQYECTLLLKQGVYNYEHVFVGDNGTGSNASVIEGSHYETENDYMAVVYYRNPRGRYDRVLGTGSLNTLNRISY